MKISKFQIYILSTFTSFLKFGNVSGLDVIQLLLISSYRKLRIVNADYYYFAFVLFGLLSAGINNSFEGILYTLRFLPVYVAFMLVREILIVDKLLMPALLLSVAQLFVFPILVYNWFSGVISGLISTYFAKKGMYFLCVIAAIFVWLSDQRSLLVAVVASLLMVVLRASWKSRFSLFILIIAVISLFGQNISNHRLYKTFDAVTDINLLNVVKVGISQAHSKSYSEFVIEERKLIGKSESGDLSLHLRLRKWLHAAADMQKNYLKIIYGVGPAYFGKAADSTFFRVFFETGIIGVALFSIWYAKLIGGIRKISSPISIYFLLSNVFLDVFYSPLLMAFMLPFLYNLRKP